MNQEIMAKAKEAKSLEELLAMVKENGIDCTEEQVKKLFDSIHADGELSDNELESVAGGLWLNDEKNKNNVKKQLL